MDINLRSFEEWYQDYNEGGAMRRAKRDAFIRGTMPPLAPANVNSGDSGHPFAVLVASKVKTYEEPKKKKRKKKKN